MNYEQIVTQLVGDLMRDYQLTAEQAAGVAGSFAHETGGFQFMQELSPLRGEGGYGFAQWTGVRRDRFEKWAEDHGLAPSSYAANLGYLEHELATDRFERTRFNLVRQAETAEEAAQIFTKQFLRPAEGLEHYPERIRYANSIMSDVVPSLDMSTIAKVDTQLPSLSVALAQNAQSPSLVDALRRPVPRDPIQRASAPVSDALPPMPRPRPDRPQAINAIDAAAPRSVSPALAYASPTVPMPPVTRRPIQPNAADLSAMTIGNTTPRLTRNGQGLTDPAAIVFNDMATNIGAPPAAQRPRFVSGPQTYAGQERMPAVPSRAPIPAQQSPHLAGRRSTDPALQAALNSRYPTRLPDIPAAMPPVSASDMVRGRSGTTAVGGPPTTRTVTSVPVSVPPMPRPRTNTTRVVATFPTGQTETQRLAALYVGGGPTRPITPVPDRLAPNAPGVGNGAGEGISPQRVAQIGVDINGNAAPFPYPAITRPIAVATQLDINPLPPMPRQRPNTGVGGPVPFPRRAGLSAPPRVPPIPLLRPNFGIGGPDMLPPTLPQMLASGANAGLDYVRQSPLAQALATVQSRQINTTPTAYVGRLRNALGISSAEAYRIANGSNNPITLEDRITGRSGSSGSTAQSISSI